MSGAITYHQQRSKCGKSGCRRCQLGIGHGPYWYSYQTVNGRAVRRYVGKQLPPDVQLAEDPGQPTSLLRVFALGGIRIERCTREQQWQVVPDSVWGQTLARKVLVYLMSFPGRMNGREQVARALWPGLDATSAEQQLEQCVTALRRILEPVYRVPNKGLVIHSDGAWLQLADQGRVWIDADAFEARLQEARSSCDAGEAERLLEEALHLYSGDYLPEERTAAWAIARRETLRRLWIGALLDLADQRTQQGNLSAAISLLEQLLTADPANEAGVQRLMVILNQSRRRVEALQVYRRCADALQRDYDMRPSQETQALYAAVRLGEAVRLPH